MTVYAGPHRGSFGSPARPCTFPQVAMMDACCHSNCPCGLSSSVCISVYSESDLTEILASIHISKQPRAWRGQTGCQGRTRRYTLQSFRQESRCSTSTSTCVTVWSKPRTPPSCCHQIHLLSNPHPLGDSYVPCPFLGIFLTSCCHLSHDLPMWPPVVLCAGDSHLPNTLITLAGPRQLQAPTGPQPLLCQQLFRPALHTWSLFHWARCTAPICSSLP